MHQLFALHANIYTFSKLTKLVNSRAIPFSSRTTGITLVILAASIAVIVKMLMKLHALTVEVRNDSFLISLEVIA